MRNNQRKQWNFVENVFNKNIAKAGQIRYNIGNNPLKF